MTNQEATDLAMQAAAPQYRPPLMQGAATDRTEVEEAAYRLGAQAAEAAATWTTDGNMDHEERARVLQMMRDGDPAADHYLPRRPDLSGEWAGDPTPRSLADDLGADPDDSETVDALADAFELGVSETFESACEAELIRFVS